MLLLILILHHVILLLSPSLITPTSHTRLQQPSHPIIPNNPIIITLIPILILHNHHLLRTKTRRHIGIHNQLIIPHLGQLLNHLNKMIILYCQSATITDHNIRGVELTNLVDNKVTHDKFDKVTFILLDVLLLWLLK